MESRTEVKKKEPLVSIITPNFNSAAFIRMTAASVFMQSYKNWEWIIVDDASTDGSIDIIKELVQKDSRIHFFPLPINQGPAFARTLAIEKSQGCYLAFLDSDDLWLPQKLKVQVAFMEKSRALFSHHAYRRISEDGHRTGVLLLPPSEVSAEDLLKRRSIGNLTVMLRKDLLAAVKIEKCAHEDLLLWYRILKKHKAVAYGLSEDLARYRVVAKSRSSRKIKGLKEVWKTYRKLMGLSLLHSLYCFFCYGVSSLKKYRKF